MSQEDYKRFFYEFRNDDGIPKYDRDIDKLIQGRRRSLEVNIGDMQTFELLSAGVQLTKPLLAPDAVSGPKDAIIEAERALKTIIGEKNPTYLSLMSNRFHVQFHSPPASTIQLPLREIRSGQIGKLVQTEAIVTKVAEVRPLIVMGRFVCLTCGTATDRIFEDGEYQPPTICEFQQRDGTPCGGKAFRLDKGNSEFIDLQRLVIQERPEDLPAGRMPDSFVAYLEDDLVDTIRPGDRITIIGILDTRPEKKLTRGMLAIFSKFLEALHVKAESEHVVDVEISPEDEAEILKLSQDIFIQEKIRESIAPLIFGFSEEKEAISYLLFGGTEKKISQGLKIRGESNILLIGDPGVGKSQILKSVSEIVARKIYTSGRGSTAAGLTASVLRDPDSNEMTLEAGAVVLADKGFAFIDEFDKMRREDRTALHEAMEQHTVSIAKAGIVATLNARTSVLAAANPREGRWDPNRPPISNISLPPTILSRFDLIFPMIDDPNPTEDRKKAAYILSVHQQGGIEEPPVSRNLLRKYIEYARRNIHPKLSQEATDRLMNYYLELRGQSVKREDKFPTISITPRQLEGLVRIAEARAKMALRDTVTRADAERSIHLFKYSYDKIAKEGGSYNVDLASGGLSTQARSDLAKLKDLLTRISRESEEGIQVTELRTKAIEIGISENKFDELMENLQREGEIYEPRPGIVRRSID